MTQIRVTMVQIVRHPKGRKKRSSVVQDSNYLMYVESRCGRGAIVLGPVNSWGTSVSGFFISLRAYDERSHETRIHMCTPFQTRSRG